MPPEFSPSQLLTLQIITAVIGYRFLMVWNYTRFSVKADSGYHLFFNSIFFGSIILYACYLLGFILSILLHESVLRFMQPMLVFFEIQNIAFGIMMGLGIFTPYLLNSTIYNDEFEYLMRAIKKMAVN